MPTEKLPGKVVRGGPPRVLRSSLTDTWYVVTSYRDLGGGRFIASAKREVHPDDAAGLEAAYQCHEDWRSGALATLAPATPTYTEVERLDRPGNRADGHRAPATPETPND
jgi:hypothetical protein